MIRFPILILCFVIQASIFAQKRNYGGIKVPTFKQAENKFILQPEYFALILPSKKIPHKPKIDLSYGMPIPGDQGTKQGSCAAWACSYGLMTYMQYTVRHWTLLNPDNNINKSHVYSPSYVYTQLNNPLDCEEGVYLDSVMAFLQTKGTVPIILGGCDTSNCSRLNTIIPKNQTTTILAYYEMYNYWNDTTQKIDTSFVKDELNMLHPVVIGVHIDSTIENNNYGDRKLSLKPIIWDKFYPCSIEFNYHAMLCVGYNDTLKAFKVLNSWGTTSFGNEGYLWISYNIFKKVIKEAYYAVNNVENIKLNMFDEFFESKQLSSKTSSKGSLHIKETTSSLKPGHFIKLEKFNITCLYTNAKNNVAVLKITDNTTNKFVISKMKTNTNDNYKKFKFKGMNIAIELHGIYPNANKSVNSTANLTCIYSSEK